MLVGQLRILFLYDSEGRAILDNLGIECRQPLRGSSHVSSVGAGMVILRVIGWVYLYHLAQQEVSKMRFTMK